MYKATLISSYYESSERKLFQGTYTGLSRMLNNGWSVGGGSNGSYILLKPARAMFAFKTEKGKYSYDMKEDILEEFDKQKLSPKSFEKFNDMLMSGKLNMYINEYGEYKLTK